MVLGLAAFLHLCRLPEKLKEAKDFCLEIGAVEVREVLEDEELCQELSEHLQLKPLELKRFRALASEVSADPSFQLVDPEEEEPDPQSPEEWAAQEQTSPVAEVHHLEEVGAPRHRPDFEEAPQAKRLFAAAAWNKPGPRGKGRGKDGLVRASGRHYFEDRDDHADDATATWSQPTAANPYFGSLATEDTCACGSSNIGRHMCYDCGRQREAPSKSQVPPHSESFGGTGAKDGGGAGGRSRFCIHCGAPHVATAKFCSDCGERVDAPPIDAPHIEGGSSGGASTGRRGATGSTKGDPKRGGYFNAEQEVEQETFQDYKKHLRDEVLKSPPSERGVGAYIRSVTGELWGRVVCDQGRSWQLASGRSAKKENEGKIWNFEKPSNVAKANTALVPQTQRQTSVLDELAEKRRQEEAALAAKREAARRRRREEDAKPNGAAARPRGAVEHVERRVDPDDNQSYTWEELRERYRGMFSEAEVLEYWQKDCKVAPSPLGPPGRGPEVRTDPDDHQVYSFDELVRKYKGAFSLAQIEEYWLEECQLY